MRPMPRKPNEARGGASTSEGAALGADHSIASSPAFGRRAVACVESWVPLAQGRVPMRGRGRGVGGCRKGAGAEVGRVPWIIDWTAALRAISWLVAVPVGTASHSMASGDADERASLMAGSVSGILASRIVLTVRGVLSLLFAGSLGGATGLVGISMDWRCRGRGVVWWSHREEKLRRVTPSGAPHPKKPKRQGSIIEMGFDPGRSISKNPCPSSCQPSSQPVRPVNGSMTSRLSCPSASQSCVKSPRTVTQLWDRRSCGSVGHSTVVFVWQSWTIPVVLGGDGRAEGGV